MLGIVGQVLSAFSFILVPALTVPPPATYIFPVAWFILLGLAIAWWRDHPWRSFLIPILAMPVVTIIYGVGARFLGWTA